MKEEDITLLAPFLWSYDVSSMDLEKDKVRIITNVLNLGTKPAVLWLFKTYARSDIKKAVMDPLSGEWGRKSLNFWAQIFDLSPRAGGRQIA